MNDTVTDTLARVRNAVRSHRPVEEVTLDLGEFGELTAFVEYEGIPAERGDYYQPSTPARILISSVRVVGLGELLPFIQSLHKDVLAEIEAKVEEKLRSA
jgi:hypothetical protein